MRTVPIQEATEAELRTFATEYLGLTIGHGAKVDTVRARVEAAWDKQHILLQDSSDPHDGAKAQAPLPAMARQLPPKPGYVRVIIAVTEGPGGSDPVPLGCNGPIMLVERGKEQDIPERYFESLRNAVQHRYDPLENGLGMNPVPRKVPLYPFQRVA